MPLPSVRTKKEPNYLKKTYLLYGDPKVGKTTTAAGFGDDDDNKVLFFATEPGHKFQEIYKWKTAKGIDPTGWGDFLNCSRELLSEDHQYKCIVIDVVDNLYKWCSEYVCLQNRIKHESDLGFGKGYALVKTEFSKPIQYLTQHGYGVIFLSHAQCRDKEIGPRKISYTDSTLPGSAQKIIHGLCDYILYFHSDSEGQRLIRTKGTENVNAGDRSGYLPELIPMNSEQLINYLKGDTL